MVKKTRPKKECREQSTAETYLLKKHREFEGQFKKGWTHLISNSNDRPKRSKKIDKILIPRILSSIDPLSNDHKSKNNKRMKGVENIHRIRVGKYRIVYKLIKIIT